MAILKGDSQKDKDVGKADVQNTRKCLPKSQLIWIFCWVFLQTL